LKVKLFCGARESLHETSYSARFLSNQVLGYVAPEMEMGQSLIGRGTVQINLTTVPGIQAGL